MSKEKSSKIPNTSGFRLREVKALRQRIDTKLVHDIRVMERDEIDNILRPEIDKLRDREIGAISARDQVTSEIEKLSAQLQLKEQERSHISEEVEKIGAVLCEKTRELQRRLKELSWLNVGGGTQEFEESMQKCASADDPCKRSGAKKRSEARRRTIDEVLADRVPATEGLQDCPSCGLACKTIEKLRKHLKTSQKCLYES